MRKYDGADGPRIEMWQTLTVTDRLLLPDALRQHVCRLPEKRLLGENLQRRSALAGLTSHVVC